MQKFASPGLLLFFCSFLPAQQIKFELPASAPTLNGPLAAVTADFNKDGYPDIAIGNTSSHSISVLLGKGDGSFAPTVNFAVASTCQIVFLAAGDFKKDGNPDLFGSCGPGQAFFVMPGNGKGGFATPLLTSFPNWPLVGFPFLDGIGGGNSMAIADYNGDGYLDFVASGVNPAAFTPNTQLSTSYFGMYLYLGRGDGTFQTGVQVSVTAGFAPVSTASGDLNGDGKPDLVAGIVDTNNDASITGGNSSIEVFLGDGKGGFTPSTTITLSQIGANIQIADLDGDTKPDLVVSGLKIQNGKFEGATLATFRGAGDGKGFTLAYTFLNPTFDTVSPGMILADLHNSGHPDILELLASPVSLQSQMVVHPSNGDGTFQNPQGLATFTLTSLAFTGGDYNGDGRFDVLALQVLFNIHLSGSDAAQQLAAALGSLPAGTMSLYTNISEPASFLNKNAASFAAGPMAPGSLASAFASGFGFTTAPVPDLPWPLTLGGNTITVTDAAGITRGASLFYQSPTQLNYVIPDGTALGPATITINNPFGIVQGKQQIAAVAPGVFQAGGIAAGVILMLHNGQQVVSNLVSTDSSGNYVPTPIDLGSASDQVFLLLFGTGIRGHTTPVTATAGSQTLTPAYAGPQGVYPGEDQINLQLPQSLKGAGAVSLTLNVDGQQSNPVQIFIQ